MEMEGEEWQKEMSSLSEKKTARVSGGWCGERSAFGVSTCPSFAGRHVLVVALTIPANPIQLSPLFTL
ncbi:hypothetical protein Csa_003342 [Cucumis sativus]|uniref:Uncharacterized protein n=1 Tax=Cucumis sativus TaxID=3659 RepID=A0A0A0KHM1_CUCSA|nr:hypothetical protein Csa_003342 [Cucumis sativus]